jgi:putative cardiolipin synthase
MGVFFEHERLVAAIRALFADEASPRKSYRLGLAGGAIAWHDEAEGRPRTQRAEPGASLSRRLAATVIGLLPLQSQL